MNKKITFLLSLLMVLVMVFGTAVVPASSYDNDVNPTTKAILLLNLDTDTVVYSRNEDVVWFTGGLGEIMTFIVALQNIKDIDKTRVDITQEHLDTLRNSDGCLDPYVGGSLSVRDLLAIMMHTSGNDAAILLAETASKGDLETFVKLMNRKASELGCTKTTFVTPGYYVSEEQLTTCSDMARIYRYAMTLDEFSQIVASPTYLPKGFKKKLTITTNNSMLVQKSPYYFRVDTGGKYSYDSGAKANFVTTTVYKKQTYLFVGLKGYKTDEKNVFVDAKQLTTWAYLNLSDRRVIPARTVMGTTMCNYPWGQVEVDLIVEDAALRTVPNDYDDAKFSTKLNAPDAVDLPVFAGQNLGTAGIVYKKKTIDKVDLVASKSCGTSMLSDLTAFIGSATRSLMPAEPPTEEPTEPQTEKETVKETVKETKKESTKETTKETQKETQASTQKESKTSETRATGE